jgi:hypothetical protein
MVGKQAIKHADLAADRSWNVDEQGYTAENILGSKDTVEAVVSKVLAAMAKEKA